MGVSAVVVTYNRLKLLKECIHNLLTQSYKLDNIFVINNNSSDGTEKYLSTLNDDIIKPINTHKNLGGAGGFSLGTKLAYEQSNSDYFWLMDDDTMPTTNSLNNLISSAKRLNNKFGYLCSNVRWWKNGEPSYLNVPVASKDWTYKLFKGNENLIKTISASFVSLLVPRHSVKKLGLPIGDMFIWGDDVEYSTRLSRLYPSYLVTNSIVLHKSAANANNETVFNVPMNRLLYYKCMFRNRIYISKRYYTLRRVIKIILLYSLFLIEVPFKSKNHRIKRFIYTLKGIINGLVFNPTIKFPRIK